MLALTETLFCVPVKAVSSLTLVNVPAIERAFAPHAGLVRLTP